MSRSKRAPFHTQGYGGKARKTYKRLANNAVKTADVANGAAFKRVFCSWEICDWKFHDPKNQKARRK
jgi:hypothetical protein